MTTETIQQGSIIESKAGKQYIVAAIYENKQGKGTRLGAYRWEDGKRVGSYRNLYSGSVQVVPAYSEALALARAIRAASCHTHPARMGLGRLMGRAHAMQTTAADMQELVSMLKAVKQ
jgi:hypothetical protein